MRAGRAGRLGLLLAGSLMLSGCGADPAPVQATRAAQFAAVRGAVYPPPAGPPAHLRGIGRARFAAPQGVIEQDLELWVGGPGRGRWALTSPGNRARNLFLLDGDSAWLSRGDALWDAYPAAELAAENALRWEIVRFPAGWEEAVAAAPTTTRRFTRAAAAGDLTIEVDEAGLPLRGEYAGVTARVAAWGAGHGAAAAAVMPVGWEWHGPSGARAETWTELRADARFFDEAFRPDADGAAPRVHGDVGERLGVMEATMWRAGAAHVDAGMDDLSWWEVDGARVAAVLLPSGAPTPDAAAVAESPTRWLRWSFLGTARDARDAARQIEALAHGAGLAPAGRPWLRLTPADATARGQIVALPVR